MGVTISLLCLVFCISCTILVRKRCLKTRAFSRARMAASNNYYPAVAQYASEGSSVQVRLEHSCSATMHEIEHLVGDECSNHIPPDTPAHLDTKVRSDFGVVVWLSTLVRSSFAFTFLFYIRGVMDFPMVT